MSAVEASNFVRKLRSYGVKVYLNTSRQVAFKGLTEETSPEIKADILRLGRAIKTFLEHEESIRKTRKTMRGRRP